MFGLTAGLSFAFDKSACDFIGNNSISNQMQFYAVDGFYLEDWV